MTGPAEKKTYTLNNLSFKERKTISEPIASFVEDVTVSENCINSRDTSS